MAYSIIQLVFGAFLDYIIVSTYGTIGATAGCQPPWCCARPYIDALSMKLINYPIITECAEAKFLCKGIAKYSGSQNRPLGRDRNYIIPYFVCINYSIKYGIDLFCTKQYGPGGIGNTCVGARLGMRATI